VSDLKRSTKIDINPISTKRVYQSVIEQFIALITSGQLKIGDKLPPERELAERFNVSRASIREAFRAMEIIGIIEVRPGGGSYVTQLNIGNFMTTIAPLFMRTSNREQDLLEFRRLLETEAVRLAAEKQIKTAISELVKAVSLMEKSMQQNDPGLGAEADVQFHRALFNCSDNYILIKAAECVSYLLESSVRMNRSLLLKDSGRAQVLLEQHRRVLDAIQRKDSNQAVQAMIDHLQYVRKSLEENPNEAS
jgi:GntR family transcriptional repressor for pyruvate dehydrogenase complex